MGNKKQLLAIESQPAVLSVNFAEVKAAIEKRVEKYDIVVTADSVADAKKLATDLNKQKNELDAKRKAAIAEVSAPIKAGDDQMKELISIYETSRQKLLDQVKRFEDETRENASAMLDSLRDELWEENGVTPEFRRAEYQDLAQKLTSVTKTGNLSASAINPLEQRVAADKALQDRTRMRIMDLENRSYKAGLKAPLSRDHIEHFLFADDDQYERDIERLLTIEVTRQDQIEEQERERAEKERLRKEKADKLREEEEAEPKPETSNQQQAPPPEQRQEPGRRSYVGGGGAAPVSTVRKAPNGKTAWEVTCTFNLECNSSITPEAIGNELRRVLEKAGVKTLTSVSVQPQQKES